MMRGGGHGLGLKGGVVLVGLLIFAAVLPVLNVYAGDMALGDPRQMKFTPVEFTPCSKTAWSSISSRTTNCR
jgi:hypothetical protein